VFHWPCFRDRGTAIYLICLAMTALALATGALLLGFSFGNAWAVGLLGIAAAVSETQRVSIARDTHASFSLIPILFAAVLFGPLAAMVVAAMSNIGAFGRPHLKWAVYTCSHTVAGAVTGFAAAVASALGGNQVSRVALAAAAGGIAAECTETAFAVVTAWLRN